ncbi:MAG: hypothetical protein ACP5TE_12445 [Verrucomicrobiia bacterium]
MHKLHCSYKSWCPKWTNRRKAMKTPSGTWTGKTEGLGPKWTNRRKAMKTGLVPHKDFAFIGVRNGLIAERQ